MRVLVAMSGGVDSSVAAALLRDEGHDVVGCTLKLWGGPSDSGCCSAADVDDARRVAQVLGIDHHVFTLTEEFDRAVIAPYVAAHARGATPNPCIECNRSIKFDALATRARRLGFDAIATGHHARVAVGAHGVELRRGRDERKDQSYVLAFLDARTLARTLLPIGELTKDEVRERAASLGLRTAAKPDSQEVCFIERGARAAFLAARTPLTPARVIDRATGETLGSVEAIQLVTVGQRRGIARGVDGEARYVAAVDVARNAVLVGRRETIEVRTIEIAPGSWAWAHGQLKDGARVLVQTSSHGVAVRAELHLGARPTLELSVPARPVAPGQTAVLYDESDPDLVVASAIVDMPDAA